MRVFYHSLYFFGVLILFSSCNHDDVYGQKIKTVDSLCGAVNAVTRKLEKTDTVALHKAITKFTHYKQFIEQNFNDTLDKQEADVLQRFYMNGENLENFSLNKHAMLLRLNLINLQLLKLRQD